jgi:hypothetical protein
MNLIPGFTVEPDKVVKVPTTENKNPIVLIYMLGGVTYGEISAFRLLGRRFSNTYLFYLCNR